MGQKHEVSKWRWNNVADRFARCRVATNLQFIKKRQLSRKLNKTEMCLYVDVSGQSDLSLFIPNNSQEINSSWESDLVGKESLKHTKMANLHPIFKGKQIFFQLFNYLFLRRIIGWKENHIWIEEAVYLLVMVFLFNLGRGLLGTINKIDFPGGLVIKNVLQCWGPRFDHCSGN